VIVATQVLESMRTEPRPTRAEVSDAANAVDDRVDAIMLAGETAIGAHPVRVIETLDRIICQAESEPAASSVALHDTHTLPAHGHAICDAAVTLAAHADAAAIVAVTRGGKTARALSGLRPSVPIVAVTDRDQIARRLMLSWGVLPMVAELSGDVGTVADRLGQDLVRRGVVPGNAVIVVVSVTPDLAPGPSNFLKVQRIRS
jgi:pyruvate kinase